jgi:hypothetical protein
MNAGNYNMFMKNDKQVVVLNPLDKLMYRHIMLFALNSLKRRHGFDVDDVTLYLSTKGRKVDVSVVKQALSVMKTNGIFEEFYSTDLNKSVYRLR